jgi:hypothetical protein
MIFVFFFQQTVEASAVDFGVLENLTIGNIVPDDIIALGHLETKPEELPKIYTIESGEYAHPHIIYVDQDKKATYIQLTVPFALEQKYQDLMQSFIKDPKKAKEQVDLDKTRSEIMVGYPSEGIGFIVNGYNNKVLRVTKYPSKTKQDFVQEEGKMYVPDGYDATASTQAEVEMIPKNPDFDIVAIFKYSILAVLVIICIAIIFIFRKRNQKKI